MPTYVSKPVPSLEDLPTLETYAAKLGTVLEQALDKEHGRLITEIKWFFTIGGYDFRAAIRQQIKSTVGLDIELLKMALAQFISETKTDYAAWEKIVEGHVGLRLLFTTGLNETALGNGLWRLSWLVEDL